MELIDGISRLKALVKTSLYYCKDDYDRERLLEMEAVLKGLITAYSDNLTNLEIERFFSSDIGYVTPKVDIRAVVFNNRSELLMVQEKSDHCWALPGGWADVGYSPGEIAIKETFEEAGISVRAKSLIKVVDKAKHPYPKSLEYVYKFFIYCVADSDDIKTGLETSDVRFLAREEIGAVYPLSLERNILADIEDVFAFYESLDLATKFD